MLNQVARQDLVPGVLRVIFPVLPDPMHQISQENGRHDAILDRILDLEVDRLWRIGPVFGRCRPQRQTNWSGRSPSCCSRRSRSDPFSLQGL